MNTMSATDNLEDLPGVGPATAEKLTDNGYDSYTSIAVASASELAAEADIGDTTASKAIKAARDKADVGGFESGSDVLERRKKIGSITVGVPEVDDILHNGIQTQGITEIYGEFGSGKSQVSHQLAVNVQLPEEYGGLGQQAFFIDTEETFRPERIEDMVHGLSDEKQAALIDQYDITDPSGDELEALTEAVLDNIIVGQAFNSDHQIMLAQQALEDAQDSDDEIGLLIVDSLTAFFRAEYVGRGELAERQQKLNKHLHDLSQFGEMLNAAVFITNQVSANPDSFFGDPTQPVGGNILGHKSTVRLYLKKSKGTKRIVRVVDAPDLPESEAVLRIEDVGLESE